MIRNGERRSRQACGERHFRILFFSSVFVSILCMKFSFSLNLTLSLSTSARVHRLINRSCARAALLDAWALCAACSSPHAPPSHFRTRSCVRVHLLDALALCAARSLSDLYLWHTGRAEPCSTRGRRAPRAPHRVHRPVTFVLGVVREYTCSTRGRCAPRGLCPSCTSGTRVVQNLARRVGAVRHALLPACTAQSLSC